MGWVTRDNCCQCRWLLLAWLLLFGRTDATPERRTTFMQQYLDLLRDIRDNGIDRGDRTERVRAQF